MVLAQNLSQNVDISSVFGRVSRHMEQHKDEIVPFVEYLLKKWNNDLTNKIAVEIGVRHGGTASLWCELGFKQVIGVDYGGIDSLGEEETLKLATEMENQYKSYQFVYGDSHNDDTIYKVDNILGDNEIDLLFLDGDHSYNGVKKDYEEYGVLVKSSGLVVFHDIVNSELTRSAGQGVSKFWEEFQCEKREFYINGEWGGIGVIET